MKNKLCLTLLLLTLSAFIISYGCGGGNDGVTPSSVSTSPNNSANMGYITIKISWPQKGMKGSCLISSGNEKGSLMASMPDDATLVYIKIRDANDTNDPNSTLTNGFFPFFWDPNVPVIEHTFGPLPAINVIIRAEAYAPSSPNTPVSVSEVKYQVKVGRNNNDNVTLNMGNYKLDFSSGPDTVLIGEEGTFTTILKIAPINSLDPNTNSLCVKGKQIKFKITPPENGSLSAENPYPAAGDLTVITDDKGECKVKLKGLETGYVQFEASFQPDPNDPNSTPFISKRTVTITDTYKLSMDATNPAAIPILGQSTITATLEIAATPTPGNLQGNISGLPTNTPTPTPTLHPRPAIPVAGKEIRFSIVSGYGCFSSNTGVTGIDPNGQWCTAITDPNGQCQALLTAADNGSIQVKAECLSYETTCNVNVPALYSYYSFNTTTNTTGDYMIVPDFIDGSQTNIKAHLSTSYV